MHSDSGTQRFNFNIKYFGEINGKLGIGTKKINQSDLTSRSSIPLNSTMLNKFKNKSNNKKTLKQPIPDLKNEKIIIFSNDPTKLNLEEEKMRQSNKFWRSTKNKFNQEEEKKLRKNLKEINLNERLINNLDFEINLKKNKVDESQNSYRYLNNQTPSILSNMNSISKNAYHSDFYNHLNFQNNFPSNVNKQSLIDLAPEIVLKKEKILARIPYVIKRIRDREFLNVSSSMEGPEAKIGRYRKPKVNLEEVLMLHKSNIRKDVKKFKVKEFQFKKSFKIEKLFSKTSKFSDKGKPDFDIGIIRLNKFE